MYLEIFYFYDPTEIVKSFSLTPVGAAPAVEGNLSAPPRTANRSLLPINNFVSD